MTALEKLQIKKIIEEEHQNTRRFFFKLGMMAFICCTISFYTCLEFTYMTSLPGYIFGIVAIMLIGASIGIKDDGGKEKKFKELSFEGKSFEEVIKELNL